MQSPFVSETHYRRQHHSHSNSIDARKLAQLDACMLFEFLTVELQPMHAIRQQRLGDLERVMGQQSFVNQLAERDGLVSVPLDW